MGWFWGWWPVGGGVESAGGEGEDGEDKCGFHGNDGSEATLTV